MPRPTKQNAERGDSRTRLLEAARDVIRTQGFAAAPYHDRDDPLERPSGCTTSAGEIMAGDLAEFTCLAVAMTHEVYGSATPGNGTQGATGGPSYD